jgi:RNA polymerase sigma-54 factor
MALEQRIEDEINENPALEEMNLAEENGKDKFSKETVQDFQNWEEYGYDDIPDYKTEYENYLPADKMPDRQLAEVVDFRTDLKKQYRFIEVDEEKYLLADFIIDSLNEHGFLVQDLEGIAEEISFKNNTWMKVEELEQILFSIQELEPLGTGSRNMKEYFLIQLRKKDESQPDIKLAIGLLEDHFADLRSGNVEKIRRDMKLSEDQIKGILHLMATLKTRPVSGSSNAMQVNDTVLPDFVITVEGDELQVSLFRQRSSALHVSQAWVESVESLEQDKTTDRATKQYMRSKLSSAQWFIKAIQEREGNMLKVMKAIVHFQYDYFRFGDVMQLKPMVLKNIADMVGLDISTVSRITCNKYADTHFGMILPKDLFTEGLVNKEGAVISNKVIQTIVEEVVSKEDKKKPYTDQQLADILSLRGYCIARRTIAKYRDQLNIPVAQMRAMWF